MTPQEAKEMDEYFYKKYGLSGTMDGYPTWDGESEELGKIKERCNDIPTRNA